LGGLIQNLLNGTSGSVSLVIFILVVLMINLMSKVFNFNIFSLLKWFSSLTIKVISRLIGKAELTYHRDLMIGKINEKRQKVKTYRFLHELIIDLGLKQLGATPYEFLFLVVTGTFILAILFCKLIFGNIWMVIMVYPVTFVGTMAILYTRANIAHDSRIEDVIEAENIISNNIKNGVVPAVRNSLNMIPLQIRGSFRDFLDNIEHKNYHVKTALLELNQQLGSISDDFIKKCIIFEMEEEHGIVGMFKDVVEINNIKMEMRTEMKRKFEEVTTNFIIGASMIFFFLGGVMAFYPNVSHFYLKHPIGQTILAIDALIVVIEFVYITYLKAKEL